MSPRRLANIMNGSDMKTCVLRQGAEAALMDPAQFAAYMRAETAKWARIVKSANVRPK